MSALLSAGVLNGQNSTLADYFEIDTIITLPMISCTGKPSRSLVSTSFEHSFFIVNKTSESKSIVLYAVKPRETVYQIDSIVLNLPSDTKLEFINLAVNEKWIALSTYNELLVFKHVNFKNVLFKKRISTKFTYYDYFGFHPNKMDLILCAELNNPYSKIDLIDVISGKIQETVDLPVECPCLFSLSPSHLIDVSKKSVVYCDPLHYNVVAYNLNFVETETFGNEALWKAFPESLIKDANAAQPGAPCFQFFLEKGNLFEYNSFKALYFINDSNLLTIRMEPAKISTNKASYIIDLWTQSDGWHLKNDSVCFATPDETHYSDIMLNKSFTGMPNFCHGKLFQCRLEADFKFDYNLYYDDWLKMNDSLLEKQNMVLKLFIYNYIKE